MSIQPTRVLVLDGATMDRLVTCRELAKDAAIEVVGSASDWRLGAKLLRNSSPDVVVIDPSVAGDSSPVDLLRELAEHAATVPRILFCGSEADFAALATEWKEASTAHVPKSVPGESLVQAIDRLHTAIVHGPEALAPTAAPPPKPKRAEQGPIDIIAVGSSTGGPDALEQLLRDLDPGLGCPLVLTQHMPENFTAQLAKRLDTNTEWKVVEATHGQVVQAKHAYLAPGGHHMLVHRKPTGTVLELNDDPKENFCRPAVDPMFRSVAEHFGGGVLAIILTGMGSDGTKGARVIHEHGGRILVQDKETSVVWGMPRFAFEAGVTEAALPLTELGSHANELVRKSRCGATKKSPFAA
ncbi:MAG: chemotaxis protein CheB [Planctomycetota bacterium]